MNVGAMVGKQSKEMYFSKVSDLYQQLNSVDSIFQQFYSLNIQSILYHSCDCYFSFAKILQSQNANTAQHSQFSLKFLVRKFLILDNVQRFCKVAVQSLREKIS